MNTAFSRDLAGMFFENMRNMLRSKRANIKTVITDVRINVSASKRRMHNIKMAKDN
jgi:hypothetical protein